MSRIVLKNGRIINRGHIEEGDLLIHNDRIERVGGIIDQRVDRELDVGGRWIIPGIIDDQVHFREPGLTHKANIYSESKAAIAGGVTSFMEMPNTKPSALTQDLLEEKYSIAAQTALANYSFYMGAGNDNLEEVLRTDPKCVCGIKAFMGSSTGDMLLDDVAALERLFQRAHMLIATHCEDEDTIRANTQAAIDRYGQNIPMDQHPVIRNAMGCLLSSSLAVDLAKRYGSRLHVLHISTADEVTLFDNSKPLSEKKITAEVCVHHLYFNSDDYADLGSRIKCNPAIKSSEHQEALFDALVDDFFDVIATDHAPHTQAEKASTYLSAPSGLPLVQHSLVLMLDFFHAGRISAERIVEKMCHAPAICFQVEGRGFLDEGHFADLAIVDPSVAWTIEPRNVLYKCGWSPLEGQQFRGRVDTTIVNGNIVYDGGQFNEAIKGRRLTFSR